jgi:hypothetical protein
MKKFVLVLALVAFLPALASADERKVASTTIEVGKTSFWRKLANVATFGIVQSTPADAVKANQPFDYAMDHDGVDTDGYTLYLNTATHASLPASALVNGTVMFRFPNGLPKGTYTFIGRAWGSGGEGLAPALDLSVTAGNPSNPRNPRIIK